MLCFAKNYKMKKIAIIISLVLITSFGGVYAQKSNNNELTIFVDGVCGMCKDRIEAAAYTVDGVETANWNVEIKELKIEFNENNFNEIALHKAIADVGHDTKKIKATDEIYAKLHGCCKYRDAEVIENHKHQEAPEEEKVEHKNNLEENIFGKIEEINSKDVSESVVGASVYWSGTTKGTVSNADGEFELKRTAETNKLVISFVGYANDTVLVNEFNTLNIVLDKGIALEDVKVTYKRKTTEVSYSNTFKLQNINQDELKKAACCNLSESFDTNPTIDVGFTDAVTGTKKIQMLGLAGKYVQITRENMPDVRGLSALYGLNYTPGAWIESIQLNTGTGSVVNGFESITGQINVEVKKPEESEKLFVNMYANEAGKLEANVNTKIDVSDKLSTGVLLHGSFLNSEWDKNDDNFIDHPAGKQLIAINRWKYRSDEVMGQFGVKATAIDNKSGQLSSFETPDPWQAEMNTERFEAWLKIGKVLNNEQFTSFGFQNSVVFHKQNSFFGKRNFDATQKSLYSNLIFQRELKAKGNEIKLGASFQADIFDENVENTEYLRNEYVPGVFFEYTFKKDDVFSLIAGIRGDYHSDYEFFATPRLHIRYAPNDQTVVRLSAGRGQRTASIFAENIGMFASARNFILHTENTGNAYELDPEIAYNTGLNFAQSIFFSEKEVIFNLDFYHTNFINKIVIDYDISPQEVHFYNLQGKSYANSFQAQVDAELFEGFDVRLAYRFNDMKSTHSDGKVKENALASRHRSFINLSYTTKKELNFDFTVNYQGKKRIPNTASNPEQYTLDEYSPSFFISNAQVSKHWKRFEIYLGVENLFNYKQENPILSVEDPNSEHFDGSLIWGPLFGRKIYGGFRISLK